MCWVEGGGWGEGAGRERGLKTMAGGRFIVLIVLWVGGDGW
jgi:hypothetical protein